MRNPAWSFSLSKGEGVLNLCRTGTARIRGDIKDPRDRTAEYVARVGDASDAGKPAHAQELGGLALFSIVLQDGDLKHSPEFYRLYGMPKPETYPILAREALVERQASTKVFRGVASYYASIVHRC